MTHLPGCRERATPRVDALGARGAGALADDPALPASRRAGTRSTRRQPACFPGAGRRHATCAEVVELQLRGAPPMAGSVVAPLQISDLPVFFAGAATPLRRAGVPPARRSTASSSTRRSGAGARPLRRARGPFDRIAVSDLAWSGRWRRARSGELWPGSSKSCSRRPDRGRIRPCSPAGWGRGSAGRRARARVCVVADGRCGGRRAGRGRMGGRALAERSPLGQLEALRPRPDL